jgi:hypothetical protein
VVGVAAGDGGSGGHADSVLPLDALVLLDAVEDTVSLAVRELCCRLGIAGGSFARSTDNLRAASCLRMSEDIFRQVVESEGKAVLKAAAEELLPVDWSAKECVVEKPDGQKKALVYASADGVLVPATTQAEKDKRRATVKRKRQAKRARKGVKRARLSAVKRGADQRYKQLYLTSFYDQDKSHRLVSVTRGDHEAMGKLLGRDAARLRLPAAEERIGLVDGAVCLQRHMDGLGLTAVGLDFCHLAGHVHEAYRELGAAPGRPGPTIPPTPQAAPESPARAQPAPAKDPRAMALLQTVKQHGYDPFWEQLLATRSALRGGRRKSMDKLLHYAAQHQDMIAYPEFLKNEWDIGTGPMEAQCKATTRRIKGSGMRWDLENAEALVALEALYQSHQWDSWWSNTRCHMN